MARPRFRCSPQAIGKATLRVREVLEQAARLYNLPTILECKTKFDLRGVAAAQARWTRHMVRGAEIPVSQTLTVRINPEAYSLQPDEMLNDTIPHEVAHLVCALDPVLGSNHDAGWRRVAISLGSTGDRCHAMKLTPVRKHKQFLYILDNDEQIVMAIGRHSSTQKRKRLYRSRESGVSIHPHHFVKELD